MLVLWDFVVEDECYFSVGCNIYEKERFVFYAKCNFSSAENEIEIFRNIMIFWNENLIRLAIYLLKNTSRNGKNIYLYHKHCFFLHSVCMSTRMVCILKRLLRYLLLMWLKLSTYCLLFLGGYHGYHEAVMTSSYTRGQFGWIKRLVQSVLLAFCTIGWATEIKRGPNVELSTDLT